MVTNSVATDCIGQVKKVQSSPELVLGTVQLGCNYGIANRVGKPSKSEAFSILELAWERGIRRFDTAPAYNSEEIIGDFCATNGLSSEMQILTKVSGLSGRKDWKGVLEGSVTNSLQRIRCDRIEAVFFHHPDDAYLVIEDQESVFDVVSNMPISSLGISVYEPKQIELLGELSGKLAFQYPYSVVDRRFENISMKIGDRYARSILLQGILGSKTLKVNAPRKARQIHKLFHAAMETSVYDPIQFTLGFLKKSSACDYCLIGIENVNQLCNVTDAWKDLNAQEFDYSVVEETVLDKIDLQCLDPRNWS